MRKTMKVILLTLTFYCLSATAFSQSITLNISNITVKETIQTLKEKTGYSFVYEVNDIDTQRKISVKTTNKSIEDVVKQVLSGQNVEFEIIGKNVVIKKKAKPLSDITETNQQINLKKITGLVTDSKGDPIIGASIIIKETAKGTISDVNGKFLLDVPANATLKLTYIGFLSKEIAVNNKNEIKITLSEDSRLLEEVVVVGYGTLKKVNLTGSVSSVKFDKLSTKPSTNTASLLQGKMAGVTVQSFSPTPGNEDVRVSIRGQGSFNNNNPLILIDGVEGNLAQVPPGDIESVSVLKDAASASIYGVRAANGVVLVTTKRGTIGKPTVSVQLDYAIQDRVVKNELLDAPTWAKTWNLIGEELGKGPDFYYYPFEIEKMTDGSDPDHWANTDWMSQIYHVAPIKKAYVSIDGGTPNVKYLISTQYLDQEGLIITSSNKQINTRANIDVQISNKIRAGLDVTFVEKRINNGKIGPYDAFTIKPTMPIKYSNGQYAFADGAYLRTRQPSSNPNYNFNKGESYTDVYNITTRGYGEIDLAKNLMFRTTLSGGVSFYRGSSFGETWALYTAEGYLIASSDHNSLGNSMGIDKSLQNENTLTYSFDIKENHKVKLLAGHSIKNYRHDDFGASVKDFPNNQLHVLSAGLNEKNVNGYSVESSLQSFFGRANYAYADKYFLEANVRTDGSSRFPKSQRYGIFPAFSGAWILSNESFLKNLGPISLLKLRGSWGRLGNQEIGDYAFQTSLVTGTNYTVGNVAQPGVAVGSLTNPNIGWESTAMSNVGLDVNFFKNKLTLTADVFNKVTSDILMRLPVPFTSGFDQGPLQNIGAVQNKGIEVNLEYRDKIRDFNYSISGNFSKINNEITNFGGLEPSINGYTINTLGHPMNTFYGLIADGFFESDADAETQKQFGVYARSGDIKYKDLSGPNGVPDGKIDTRYDRTYLGNAFPEFTYSFNLACDWKGFDFSLFFQGVSGISTVNMMNTDVNELNRNFTKRVLDANTADYTTGSWPRWGNAGNNIFNGWSSFWIEDGSYLRLKNLELGYTLPTLLTHKMGLNSLRIYFSGSNLLTFTKVKDFDPEKPFTDSRDNSYPQSKIYSVGINLSL